MKSDTPGPFADFTALHLTDTHFWAANVQLCRHSPSCGECCWPYLYFKSRLPREELRMGTRAPRFEEVRKLAIVYAWELFHGEEVPRNVRVFRHCDTIICANPHHLKMTCSAAHLDAVRTGPFVRWTCPHIGSL